jgi:hypothetical protein
MAEVLLKVGDVGISKGTEYKDGDVVTAFNDRRISQVHVNRICHVNKFGFNIDGLRPVNTLAQYMLEKTRQYKFVRVSKKAVKRINLLKLNEDIITDVPNASGEYMHVDLFLQYKRATINHKVFGNTGKEIWYGGNTIYTEANLNTVWTEIESKTSETKANNNRWPVTNLEKKHFLALTVDDGDDTTFTELMSPITNSSNDILIKRLHYIDWQNLDLGISVQDVQDETKEVDNRAIRSYVRSVVVLDRQ